MLQKEENMIMLDELFMFFFRRAHSVEKSALYYLKLQFKRRKTAAPLSDIIVLLLLESHYLSSGDIYKLYCTCEHTRKEISEFLIENFCTNFSKLSVCE